MNWIDFLFRLTEIVGTVAFAVSGAMAAVRKRLDIFGVLFIGGVTALGGGTVRDVLLGHFPPRMFYSFEFLLIAAVSSLVIFILAYRWNEVYTINENHLNAINNLFDAIGLAAFVVTGTQAAISAGFSDNPFLCISLGMTTGVGGGILRDVMCLEMPAVLRKHIYAVAAIAGALVYYLLYHFADNTTLATGLSALTTLTIRLLATYYRWNLPRVGSREE